jgi:hypothetical protein
MAATQATNAIRSAANCDENRRAIAPKDPRNKADFDQRVIDGAVRYIELCHNSECSKHLVVERDLDLGEAVLSNLGYG